MNSKTIVKMEKKLKTLKKKTNSKTTVKMKKKTQAKKQSR
jgi:hypothetical protein